MSTELFWLVLTVAMTGVLWVPYILDLMVRRLMGALANPSPKDKPQSPWAQRMMAAHINAVENLIVFASARFDGAGTETRHRYDGLRLRTLFLGAPCACSSSIRWAFPCCARCPSRPVSSRRRYWCWRSSNSS